MAVSKQDRPLSKLAKFGIGAFGGLLPVLVSLLAVDMATVIDHRDTLTLGIYVGYFARVIILCVLGGTVALLNAEVTKAMTLVQLGIAAPALLTSYINGSTVPPKTASRTALHISLISKASADELVYHVPPIQDHHLTLVDWLNDFRLGLGTNLGSVVSGRLSSSSGLQYAITKLATGECSNVFTTESVEDLQKTFPSSAYTVQLGMCPK